MPKCNASMDSHLRLKILPVDLQLSSLSSTTVTAPHKAASKMNLPSTEVYVSKVPGALVPSLRSPVIWTFNLPLGHLML